MITPGQTPGPGRQHTDREFEGELRLLRDRIMAMGDRVSVSVAKSVEALVKRDSDLARRIIAGDTEIDRMELEIDELCLQILARRQPVASDLRFVAAALKLVTDLERIGDLATNMGKRVVELNLESQLRPYVDLKLMAAIVGEMIREALEAFEQKDVARAERVIERDRDVDAYNTQIFRELLTYMIEDPRNVSRAINIQGIAKTLERAGDHAKNLAEMAIFMTGGRDIRHGGLRDSSEA